MAEEALQVNVAALVLARIAIDASSGGADLVAVDVESADFVLARPGVDLEVPQTGHGLGGSSGAGEGRDGRQEGGRLHVDGRGQEEKVMRDGGKEEKEDQEGSAG